METTLNHTLSCIADITKIRFQISKQTVVTGGQVITVSKVILLYEARVMNSLLGNHRLVDWTAVLDLWQGVWARSQAPHIKGPHMTSYKYCLAFHQHNGYPECTFFSHTWNMKIFSV